MTKIDYVLNTYRRPYLFERQLDVVHNQTIPTSMVWVWNNGATPVSVPGTVVSNASDNLGVWARFAFALNSKADYVCILDDDTIPGPEWSESCLKTMKTHEGVLGTVGLIFDQGQYQVGQYRRVGWPADEWYESNNEQTVKADIAGHAWFFPRDLLSSFWRDLPPREFNSLIAGEDVHLSRIAQECGLGTYVPPHPPDNRRQWGSLDGHLGLRDGLAGRHYPHRGHDSVASITIMNDHLQFARKRGMKLVCEEAKDAYA